MVSNFSRRRWLRFSLRTLFVAMTVLAIVGGWAAYQIQWIHARNLARERHELDRLFVPDGQPYFLQDRPRPAPLSIRIFGEHGVALVGLFPLTADPAEEARKLKRLFPEARVGLLEHGRDPKILAE